MTNVTDTKTRPGFKRCAVGKIDLKGRFVYIDEEIEQLLGYTKEELFGCHLVDFLDESSRELIDQLLAHRNHYESFFDATVLTLLTKQGKPVSARTVVTLNFIAGNPVNFQLIMDAAENGASAADSPGADHLPVEEFIDGLLEAGAAIEPRELLSLVREFAGAVQGSLYLVKDGHLEPRAGSSADGSIEFAFRDIPEPNELHQRIASEGGDYAFTEGISIQEGVTTSGAAPDEYISVLPRVDGEPYLLRLIFGADVTGGAASAAIERSRLAVKLWRHEVESAAAQHRQADSGVDIQFTVGFLDHLGIGSALIDRSGAVIGYNRTLTEMTGTEQPGDDFRQLCDLLAAGSSHEVRRTMESHFAARAEGTAEAADLRLDISVPDGKSAEVAVVALSDQPGDLSSCVVLMPPGGAGSPDVAGGEQFWLSILGALKGPLADVVENVNEISHELYNRSGESNNARITRTVEAARTIAGVVEDASELLRAGAEQPDWDVVDLHLLVYDLFEEIRQWYPQVHAVLQADGLPKLRTYRNRLRRVLRSVLSNAFKFHSGNELAVQVEATVESGEACLRISDNGRGIAAKDVPRVFEYGYAVSDSSVHRPGTGLGLSLTRELLRAVGGDMELESVPDNGTRVTVRIPAETVE